MDSDDPPDDRPTIQHRMAVIYDSQGIPYFTLPFDQITPETISMIYRYRCNGNPLKVEDLLRRFNALSSHPLIVVAERDGGKKYETSGILARKLVYLRKRDKTPSGILLRHQDQTLDSQEVVYFNRLRAVRPWGKHA